MLQIGRGQQNISTVQSRRSQIALGDLYQLYAQATRAAEQKAQIMLHTSAGDYTLTVAADPKKGAVWQLTLRSRAENHHLWTISTSNVPAVHNRLMSDAK